MCRPCRAQHVHRIFLPFSCFQPRAREGAQCRLACCIHAETRKPFHEATDPIDDLDLIRHRRTVERLLNRKQRTAHNQVETGIEVLLIISPSLAASPLPALANRMSILPFCRLTVSKRRSRSSRFAASPRTPVTFRPISLTADRVSSGLHETSSETMHVTAFGLHRLEATAPWGRGTGRAELKKKSTPSGKKISPPDLAHFAMLSRGNCWLSVEGIPEPIPLTGGDCFVLARGTSIVLRDSPRTRPKWSFREIGARANCNVAHYGGGGAPTTIVCGSLSFDRASLKPITQLLPSFILMKADQARTLALHNTIQALAAEMAEQTPGSEVVATRLAEVLFNTASPPFPCGSDRVIPFLKALEHLGRRTLGSTAVKDGFRSIFNSQLNLLRSCISAQKRYNHKSGIQPCRDSSGADKVAVYRNSCVCQKCAVIRYQMANTPMTSLHVYEREYRLHHTAGLRCRLKTGALRFSTCLRMSWSTSSSCMSACCP